MYNKMLCSLMKLFMINTQISLVDLLYLNGILIL